MIEFDLSFDVTNKHADGKKQQFPITAHRVLKKHLPT